MREIDQRMVSFRLPRFDHGIACSCCTRHTEVKIEFSAKHPPSNPADSLSRHVALKTGSFAFADLLRKFPNAHQDR